MLLRYGNVREESDELWWRPEIRHKKKAVKIRKSLKEKGIEEVIILNEDMYDVFRYSDRYSNHLRQRETRTCMMSSGILMDIRITFDKEKRGHVWCLQVFSLIFELPSTKRNQDMYDVFRYSHRYSNHLRQRETRTGMMSSGILIDIRITFDKEKRGHVWRLRVFSLILELPSTKRNEDMYDVFRDSHWYSNHLRKREMRTCMMSSGILTDIRITFNKDKWGHAWCLQVFSLIFELPLTKRNEDMYDVFRYSHRYSNYLRTRETRTCMMSSGILIDIRVTFDKEKRGHEWCLQVFSSTYELPSTKKNKGKLRCLQVFLYLWKPWHFKYSTI